MQEAMAMAAAMDSEVSYDELGEPFDTKVPGVFAIFVFHLFILD